MEKKFNSHIFVEGRTGEGVAKRSYQFRAAPATLDDEAMSVGVVCATSDPCKMFDWWIGESYDEIIKVKGAVIPEIGQIPLLDSHSRHSVQNVIGSVSEFEVSEDGRQLLGVVRFSRDCQAGKETFAKVKSGHVTDFSIGYSPVEEVLLKEGQEQTVDGEKHVGPCTIITKWQLYELSVCAIGADPKAKVRELSMPKDFLENPPLGAQRSEKDAKEDDKDKDEEEKSKKSKKSEDEDKDEEEEEKSKKSKKSEDEDEDKDEEEKSKKSEDEEDENKKKDKRSRAVQNERERVAYLYNLKERFPNVSQKFINKLIDDGVTIERAAAEVLAHIGERGGSGVGLQVTRDGTETFRRGFVDALAIKGGFVLDKPAPNAVDYSRYSMVELSRNLLSQCGIASNGGKDEVIKRALSSTDLPVLLQEGTQRFVMQGYEEAAETWQDWTGEYSVPDFRPYKLVSSDIDNSFNDVTEGGEYTYTTMTEDFEEMFVRTYGKGFMVTRKALINDDLGQITQNARRLGQGIVREIANSVYDVFKMNPTMKDGVALFNVAHNNIVTAGDGTVSVTNIAAALTRMAQQTNKFGKRLSIRPNYLLAPLEMAAQAETFFISEMIGTAEKPTTRNIFHGMFSRVYEPRLGDISPNEFYMVGPRDMGVLVGYLENNRTPYTEIDKGFDVDAVKYKVRFEYGIKALDYRNFIKVVAE